MKTEQIKQHLDEGQTVYWSSPLYKVVRDSASSSGLVIQSNIGFCTNLVPGDERLCFVQPVALTPE